MSNLLPKMKNGQSSLAWLLQTDRYEEFQPDHKNADDKMTGD